MRELERETAARLAQLAREHSQRTTEIRNQAERERAEARKEYERKLEDEKLEYERQKREREIKQKEQLEDLDLSLQERINKAAEKFAEEHEITKEWLDAIYQLYKQKYGPGGEIEQLYNYLMQMVQNSLNAVQNSPIPSPQGWMSPLPTGNQPDINRAEGGLDILTHPTTILAGEAGPEAVWSIPLGRSGVNVDQISGQLPAGMELPANVGGSSQIVLDVSLAPGLVANIVDQSLDKTADLLFRVQRRNK